MEGDLEKALSLAEVMFILVLGISDVRVRGEDESRVPAGRSGSSLCPGSPVGLESLTLLDAGNWASAVNDQSLPELKPARDSARPLQTPCEAGDLSVSPSPTSRAGLLATPLVRDSIFAVTFVSTSRG